jgi:hypothetical protein
MKGKAHDTVRFLAARGGAVGAQSILGVLH